MRKSDHAEEQQQPELAATENNLSHATTNLEIILCNYLPAQEMIFKHLSQRDLLKIWDVSYSCRFAISCYLGGVKTIHENRGQFAGVDTGGLSVILPHTRSLQTFTSRNVLDYDDVTTLLTYNPNLSVFREISTPKFRRFLTSSTLRLNSLSAIDFVNLTVDHDIPRLFIQLSDSCINLSHVWLRMTNEVLNDEALSAIGRLPSLESLKLKNVTIRGGLSNLFSNCPCLKRFDSEDCTITDDIISDGSRPRGTLEHFRCSHTLIDDDDYDPDYPSQVTKIVLANRKLQSLQVRNKTVTTCETPTFDAMIDHLDNVQKLGFTNLRGFQNIGSSFLRFIRKFTYLSHLSIYSHHISQEWLDVIATNCSNLTQLVLSEDDRKPLDSNDEDGIIVEVDISQICVRNTKLKHMDIQLERNITLASCRSLTTLELKYLRLHYAINSRTDEFLAILSARFEGVTRIYPLHDTTWVDGLVAIIQKDYKPSDDVFNFPNYEL